MKINFYYFGKQCPIIEETLHLYKDDKNIKCIDVSEDFALAKQKKMFFPFLSECEDKRYFSPLNRDLYALIEKQEKETPYIRDLSNMQREGELIPLTIDTISLCKEVCSLHGCTQACINKGKFLSKYQEVYGFLHKYNNEVVAGVEYLPSIVVPYDIPKNEESALITCLYSPYFDYDYRSVPLNKLEEYLKGKYQFLYVISDEDSYFPNGTLSFFINKGYDDLGILSKEEGYCTLHLLRKELI